MSKKTPTIHFYDTDLGYIHYVSVIDEKLELDMRVYDAVRAYEEMEYTAAQTLQFHLSPDKLKEFWIGLSIEARQQYMEEGLAVVAGATTWMNKLMLNSPLRDPDKWKKFGRNLFHKQRAQRRAAFAKMVFPLMLTGQQLPAQIGPVATGTGVVNSHT